jgi:threonylcarbamoyladenosine tRNA methylthiotransferase MtaB
LDAIEARVGESFVGMDVIAGFPSETDAEHRETVRRLAGLPWTKIHVFPYSERAGTYACRLQPKVPPAEITARAQELRELSHERYHRRAADLVGREREVLVLNSRSTAGTGLSSDNWTVRVSDHPGGGSPTPGALARVRVTGYDPAPRSRGEGYLFGEWLDA